MSQHYVVTLELNRRNDLTSEAADQLMTDLGAFHPAIGAGPAGHLEITLSLPAETLAGAVRLAVGLVDDDVLAVRAMPETLRDQRAGWEPTRDYLSVTDVAKRLSISRQAVLGLIGRGRLPHIRIGEAYGIPEDAVAARAAQAGE